VTQRSRTTRVVFAKAMFLLLALSQPSWGSVYVHWSDPQLPAASSLGVTDIVLTWKEGMSPVTATARKQEYRVYVETPIPEAKAAAEEGMKAGWTGVILDIPESESGKSESRIAELRSAYPKLRFLVLDYVGKRPDMRGSLIVKRDSVLEVSSPTAQPWIDANLALIKVEQRSRPKQVPLYTFSWEEQGQQRTLSADDYSLAVAEAGAFHGDLVLQLDEPLQKALNQGDPEAWAFWNQVRSMLKFSGGDRDRSLQPAANVGVVVDQLDTSDEVLNLLSRHNIPFQVFRPSDLKSVDLKSFDVFIVFAKPDAETSERIKDLATRGATVVVVDLHDRYPWQASQPVQVNEHTKSYAVGSGKVLELAEPVTDPEIFAQDIRRLLGKKKALINLWNGLTTIVVPYKDGSGVVKALEFVNYAAEPLRVQVQVKGSFRGVRYESPEHGCCESLVPVQHDGFTEFVIPDLRIAGRVHLDPQ
jgi:hypothetical protein